MGWQMFTKHLFQWGVRSWSAKCSRLLIFYPVKILQKQNSLQAFVMDKNNSWNTFLFITALFSIAKRWKQPKCLPVDERINKSSKYMQWNIWGQYAMWAKPTTKRQKLYDFTYELARVVSHRGRKQNLIARGWVLGGENGELPNINSLRRWKISGDG